MQSEIKGGQAFSYIDVMLEPDEAVITESDAMSSMDADLDLTATLNGGLIKGLLKKFLGGETLFISKIENNTPSSRRLTIVQPTPGEIKSVNLQGNTLFLQPGAFIACTEKVKLGLKWAGFTSFIAREGLFRLTVSGEGTVWYGAYGALVEKEITGEYIVDTSHLVAYDPGIQLKLQLASVDLTVSEAALGLFAGVSAAR